MTVLPLHTGVGTRGSAGLITISGNNFGIRGPILTLLDRVLQVEEFDHTWITFYIPPGQGRDLPISVNISSQTTADSPWFFSYMQPVVQSIIPINLRANTRGGETVTLEGENFGKRFSVWCMSNSRDHKIVRLG